MMKQQNDTPNETSIRFLFIMHDKTNTSLAELRETYITTVSASIIQ